MLLWGHPLMKLFVLIVSPSVSFLFEITISVISYQLSVISYQLSVISYQLFSPCSLLPTSPLPTEKAAMQPFLGVQAA